LRRQLAIISVVPESFDRAARIADQYELGIRAADALHLAIAFAYGATLCTLDRRLSAAGPPLGVATLLV
jgi:predicted nucleic acid-binding protein